jgi:sulfur-oxidizing protein SoxZ
MGNMKIKAKVKGDIVSAKVMAKHEMLTYNAAKKKGKEANFITYITGKVGDTTVFEASTSQFLSKNPLFKFKFKGAKKGDELTMTWTDLKGNTVTESKKIK